MRVGMIGLGWAPDEAGGLNRYFRGLHDGLVGAGVDVRAHVLAPAAAPPAGVVLGPHHSAPLRQRWRSTAATAGRWARSGSVDVLDGHFALMTAAALSRAEARRLPLVVHFQGPWAAESRASGQAAAAAAVKRRLERVVYHRADRLIVLSEAFREILLGYGVDAERVRRVTPGVDLQRFRPLDATERAQARRDLGLPLDRPVAATVRRLVPRMGLDVLLEAWAAGPARRADRPVLVVVGVGESRSALEQQSERLGITDSVRFTGLLPDVDLPRLYAAADVAVTPTTSLEGFGLVLLEALACGTPVLASRVGGMREALAGLPDAHLLPPGDVPTLARALEDVWDGTAALADPAACRAHAERFTWQENARQVLEVYREAVVRRSSGRADG